MQYDRARQNQSFRPANFHNLVDGTERGEAAETTTSPAPLG